jgi:hypothetical protein
MDADFRHEGLSCTLKVHVRVHSARVGRLALSSVGVEMLRRNRTRLACCLIAMALRTGGSADPPATLDLDAEPLDLRGQATRLQLLGLVEVYSIALYLPRSAVDRDTIASPQTPKALRIEVRYEPGQFQRISEDWRRELIPPLRPAEVTHLRGTFASLKAGDVVLIAYTPKKGTTVRVNDESTAVPNGHHDAMVAFLDHWLGQKPVSEDIKRALLRTP